MRSLFSVTCWITLSTVFSLGVQGNPKYQRFFVNIKAINFVDATKHGFRIVLLDSFLDSYLAPIQIPTLFITAVPLKSDEATVTRVFYPDNIREDKQVSITDLNERSWYYICIEWENFNRHNESTGTDCRTLRTLDRFGKSAESSVSDVEINDISSTAMHFRVRSLVDFPMRLTASLQGGAGALPSSQTFVFRESTDLDVLFAYLKQDTEYGKLCILEEPLITGYTTMGRMIADMHIEKCYFGKLRTKDYELSTFDTEASPYKRTASADSLGAKKSSFLVLFLWVLLKLVNR
ncbi:hypothetical protein Tcan_17190 [Toxocara canis]|uniref:Uncharacterized protein n=2 Tax=Toxocara canis TaxID=6265 RepID=A0A0B2VF27_TOXCA|nr:hypothetical protein Tcan_17190 [Toxocara canis]VDM44110.1 unnamed protein product [Toxocara canis]